MLPAELLADVDGLIRRAKMPQDSDQFAGAQMSKLEAHIDTITVEQIDEDQITPLS